MKKELAIFSLLFSLCASQLRLNHVQTKGTHNSYHVATFPNVPPWNYTHVSLSNQLSAGIRWLEIDFNPNASSTDYGVFHIARYDEGTNCATLRTCLTEIRTWSVSHPSHFPIFVMLEPKFVGYNFTASDWDSFDGILGSIFPRASVITPDDVRGTKPNLRAAVYNNPAAWPTVKSSRGKVVFGILNIPGVDLYSVGTHANLAGRLAFRLIDLSDTSSGDAALITTDYANLSLNISRAVNSSFIVRTLTEGGYVPGGSSRTITEVYGDYFTVMDIDQNGFLTVEEIVNLLSAMGVSVPQSLLTQILVGACQTNLTVGATFANFACSLQTAASLGLTLATVPPSVAACNALKNSAINSGVHFVATDWTEPPFQGANPDTDYWVSIPNTNSTSPVRCHPFFTAGTDCQSSWAEPGPEPEPEVSTEQSVGTFLAPVASALILTLVFSS